MKNLENINHIGRKENGKMVISQGKGGTLGMSQSKFSDDYIDSFSCRHIK